MMILPWGLGSRTPRFPWATVAVILVTTGFSALHFSDVDRFAAHPVQDKILTSYQTLVLTYCPQAGQSPAACDLLGDSLQENAPERAPASLPDHLTLWQMVEDLQDYSHWMGKQLRNTTDARLKAFPEMIDFRKTQSEFSEVIRTEYPYFLAHDNIQFKSIFGSQFLHGGLLHLLGNMLVLLALGIYVESRVGIVMFLGIYILGGTLGLLSEAYFFSNSLSHFVIGASANVSAVMGAFLALFFHTRMRFLMSFIVWNRIFIWPTAVILPILYLASDLTGILGSDSSSVAHSAHLAGFALGASLGILLRKIDPLPQGHLYPAESDLLKELRSAQAPSDFLTLAKGLLKMNPESLQTLAEIVLRGFKNEVPPEVTQMHLGRFLTLALRQHRIDLILAVLKEAPQDFDFVAALINQVSSSTLLLTCGALLSSKNFAGALKLYEAHQVIFPKSKKHSAIATTIGALQTHLHSGGQDVASQSAA
jgi:membrane associated rhomboid family serine protease